MAPRSISAVSVPLLAVLALAGCGGSGSDDSWARNDGATTATDAGSDSGAGAGGDTDGDAGADGGDGTDGMAGGNQLFPARVPDPDDRSVSLGRTLDGISLRDERFGGREWSLPVPDVDDDGRTDYAFLAPAGTVSDCVAGVLLPSATLPSAALVASDLERALRVAYGSGSDCRDVSSVLVIGDVNGDGRKDLAVDLFDQGIGAVVFGGLVDGLVDVLDLDGQNGFVLNGIRPERVGHRFSALTSPGDLNGDGIDDILFKDTGVSAPQAWRIIPGRASFPASRGGGEIDPVEVLLSLRPEAVVNAVGDLDGDGADDVVVRNRLDVGPQVVYGRAGNSVITIEEGVELVRDCTAGSYCEAEPLGDMDADGFDDLLVTHSLGTSGCGYGARTVVFYGGDAGVISLDTLDDRPNPRMTRIVEGVANPCSAGGGGIGAVGDLDGDGASDFAIHGAYETGDGIIFGRHGDRPDIVWLDDLDGSAGLLFDDFERRRGSFDVDGDGFDDLVFEDDSVFPGRERRLDANAPAGFSVERGPALMVASWEPQALARAAGYRLEMDGRLVAELDADADEFRFDPLDGATAELVLSVLSADGEVLGQGLRRVPAFEPLEAMSAIVYAPRLVQVSFPGDARVRRYGRYLVWRDGVPLGRAPDGAYDYVDDTVEPDTTYRYFVTPDYLPQGSLDPVDAGAGPLLRRRSETIEVTTPAG